LFGSAQISQNEKSLLTLKYKNVPKSPGIVPEKKPRPGAFIGYNPEHPSYHFTD
jgi:hypothetical protein